MNYSTLRLRISEEFLNQELKDSRFSQNINMKQHSNNLYSIDQDSGFFKKEKVSSFAEIWECQKTGAKSLHSLLSFQPGEIITQLGINFYLENPTYLSLQIDEFKHIMLEPEFLQYINHSCEPNLFFDTSEMNIICLKEIQIGEAMTFFYPSTEWSMTQGFDCLCGSRECLGKIAGAKFLSVDVLKK